MCNEEESGEKGEGMMGMRSWKDLPVIVSLRRIRNGPRTWLSAHITGLQRKRGARKRKRQSHPQSLFTTFETCVLCAEGDQGLEPSVHYTGNVCP